MVKTYKQWLQYWLVLKVPFFKQNWFLLWMLSMKFIRSCCQNSRVFCEYILDLTKYSYSMAGSQFYPERSQNCVALTNYGIHKNEIFPQNLSLSFYPARVVWTLNFTEINWVVVLVLCSLGNLFWPLLFYRETIRPDDVSF